MRVIWLLMSLLLTGATMQAEKITVQGPLTAELLGRAVQVRYTNWRGETALRSVVPLEIFWGKTEYHPHEQWLVRVWDVERDAERMYAFKDIKEIIG